MAGILAYPPILRVLIVSHIKKKRAGVGGDGICDGKMVKENHSRRWEHKRYVLKKGLGQRFPVRASGVEVFPGEPCEPASLPLMLSLTSWLGMRPRDVNPISSCLLSHIPFPCRQNPAEFGRNPESQHGACGNGNGCLS